MKKLVSQSAAAKNINGKLCGRKKCGRENAQRSKVEIESVFKSILILDPMYSSCIQSCLVSN